MATPTELKMPLKSGLPSKSYSTVIVNNAVIVCDIHGLKPTVNSVTNPVRTSPCGGTKVINGFFARTSSRVESRASMPFDSILVIN